MKNKREKEDKKSFAPLDHEVAPLSCRSQWYSPEYNEQRLDEYCPLVVGKAHASLGLSPNLSKFFFMINNFPQFVSFKTYSWVRRRGGVEGRGRVKRRINENKFPSKIP